jgi:Flp pilus assembly pilin Flp
MKKRTEQRKNRPRNAPTRSLASDTRGLTTVEYIIILCLIAVVGFAIWKKFGETVKTKANAADTVIGGLPETAGGEGGMM